MTTTPRRTCQRGDGGGRRAVDDERAARPPLPHRVLQPLATRLENANDFIYVSEGMTASVAVSQLSNGVLNYHNAGKVASSEPQDMRLQRMLGHLTTRCLRTPIRCSSSAVARASAGAVSIDPALQSETIAEIEPLVPAVVSKYFGAHNYNVVTNPKVHVEIDDARHFILTTKQKFDEVTTDPLDPWVKGAATLYTKEFFDVVKEHLNPGGVVTLFVQLYESSPEAVKSEVATFFQAFPNGVVFGNTNNGAGYDLVLVGQMGTMHINVDDIEQRLQSPQYAQVAQSLHEIGINSATELFATFAGNEPMLRPWLADAQINHDRNLRLQFLAGLVEPLRSRLPSTVRCPVPALSRQSARRRRAAAQIRMATGGANRGQQVLVTGLRSPEPETKRPET